MQVLYDERAETPLGPFSVEAKLAGQRGLQTFASGKGRARNKQLAKQVGHLGHPGRPGLWMGSQSCGCKMHLLSSHVTHGMGGRLTGQS